MRTTGKGVETIATQPHYYNEFDPFAAAWLRALIAAGELPPGDVDERSIEEVKADELRGYSQCHFFAGIGGWPLALRWAGVAADEPVWTGSCPCQPFSAAGKRKGTADARHLWPVFGRLIADARPPVVFGEQVASKDGRLWLDGVRADVEALGYAFGAADLCAAGIGAPHIRQRLFWVADSGSSERGRWAEPCGEHGGTLHVANGRSPDGLAESQSSGGRTHPGAIRGRTAAGIREPEGEDQGWAGEQAGRPSDRGTACRVADAECSGVRMPGCGADSPATGGVQGEDGERQRIRPDTGTACHPELLGVEYSTGDEREQGRPKSVGRCAASGCSRSGMGDTESVGHRSEPQRRSDRKGEAQGREFITGGSGAWSDCRLIPCRDGKARRIESSTEPLAHGIPGRVGLLRGYGNAIVPQVAAEFIQAWLEVRVDR